MRVSWGDWTRTATQKRRHDPAWVRAGQLGVAFAVGMGAGIGWCLWTMAGSLYCGWPW